ncbi:hypothetical protein IMZ48_42005 [Candidatus Bathyarchaeota archaeon]|nr:hypothetical protein [Candidatus Bathyarchaeota archaeon]
MEARDTSPPPPMSDGEKGVPQPPVIPSGYGGHNRPKDAAETVQDEPFMTRHGLNLTSFRMRDYGRGLVELDRAMSKRHLSMIAIGGSIGIGFFVGSGKALATGVSEARPGEAQAADWFDFRRGKANLAGHAGSRLGFD